MLQVASVPAGPTRSRYTENATSAHTCPGLSRPSSSRKSHQATNDTSFRLTFTYSLWVTRKASRQESLVILSGAARCGYPGIPLATTVTSVLSTVLWRINDVNATVYCLSTHLAAPLGCSQVPRAERLRPWPELNCRKQPFRLAREHPSGTACTSAPGTCLFRVYCIGNQTLCVTWAGCVRTLARFQKHRRVRWQPPSAMRLAAARKHGATSDQAC